MALNGKVAVVTGAALGIGKATAELLLRNGAKVVLLDVNETAGKALEEALNKQYGQERSLFLKCDVESEEQVKAAFQSTAETFGGMDIVCNNAGILNEGEWEKTVSINLMGVIRVTYVALEHMNKLTGGRGGVMINTTSMAGVDRYDMFTTGLGPLPSCPVYTATKHAVVGFTRAMAAASAASGFGIRFNTVCPGLVQTDLSARILVNLGQFSHLSDIIQKCADKMLSVSDVADCVLELVTDETKNGDALMLQHNQRKYMIFPTFT